MGFAGKAVLALSRESSRARRDLADRVYPQYADFREQAGKAGRVIPIIQLAPR